MPKKIIPIEEVELRIANIHGDTVSIDRDSYVGTSKNALFVDKDFGQWSAYVSNVLVGHCHPLRGRKNIEETCLKKYGSKSHLSNVEIRKKIAKTCLARFGEDNPMKSSIISDKVKATCMERYGVDNPIKNEVIKANKLNTCIQRYGGKSPMASIEVRKRAVDACIKNFGVENPMQVEHIKSKAQATCFERYGVKNPAQNNEIHKKSARSMKNARHVKHWKTGEILTCVGSYELATVTWLNKNKVDFDWQVAVKIPETANENIKGRTYNVDAFIKSYDDIKIEAFVEIKGRWMQELSKNKWDWFHNEYSCNSFLWTKDVLKAIGVL